MIETNGKFYLGRLFDPQMGETTPAPLLYDPADLTTHAVVVGMTGSGKTGLCIDMLEEAALHHIPALMIDPKGDITNALLHFPSLAPQDFLPWIDPAEARRNGKTVEQAATDTAALWKKGLAQWDIPPERLQALQDSAQFTVFTPGSDAGEPVSILATLEAPALPWEAHKEILRERISGTVTALLGLTGLRDIDPVRSREHILLANIFETAWSAGKDLDLGELIMQTQNPPFGKLGVFDTNTFYPEKDRFSLAMSLNNILAAPGFQSWIDGVPLDIPGLLYTPDGRPRHSVFYIAHLNDEERMFFVTLLFSAFETWMRTQSGTNSLRALLYFDEIFGYLPPTANPPSKGPLLRMSKQARAFGVGLVLVTQNPVDVDYKAISNTGSWFIGKLQTDRDKERLLDGLEGAAGGQLDRQTYDKLISALGKRVFLLHNVHGKGPQLFQTRWAMNYLAGPLTRAQIPALNALAARAVGDAAPPPGVRRASGSGFLPGAQPAGDAAPSPGAGPLSGTPFSPESSAPVAAQGSATRPGLPSGVAEYFLPHTLTLSQAAQVARRALAPDTKSRGLLYRPVLFAQAEVRFSNRKYNLDFDLRQAALVPEPVRRGPVRWDDFSVAALDPRSLDRGPAPEARFAMLEEPFSNASAMAALGRDFADWAYRSLAVAVRANEALGVYAGPNVSQGDFREMCAAAAREKRDAELAKTLAAIDRKLDALKTKLAREERELGQDQTELQQRKMEEVGTHAENLLSLLGGRRKRLTTSLTKRRLTEQAKGDVEESEATIADFKRQIAALEREKQTAPEDARQKLAGVVDGVTEIRVNPLKKDVLVQLFGVAWFPYLLVETGGQIIELPGFGKAD